MSSSETTLLTVFTGIVALAFVLQSLACIGVFRAVRKLSERLEGMSAETTKSILSLSSNLNELLSALRRIVGKVEGIAEPVSAVTKLVHQRAVDLDSFVEETTDAARLQVAKIQDLVETSSTKIEETFAMVQKGIVAPVNEIAALIRGLKVGLGFFFRGRRSPSDQSHHDEEMFI
jgi:methyl-accepting chemotaxis protein